MTGDGRRRAARTLAVQLKVGRDIENEVRALLDVALPVHPQLARVGRRQPLLCRNRGTQAGGRALCELTHAARQRTTGHQAAHTT